jgi:hypothetical protein
MNLTKLALPAFFGLLFAAGVVGFWVNQIIQLSYRTDGTMFSEYAPKFPAVKNPAPNEWAPFCDPAYKTRWAGCTLKQ